MAGTAVPASVAGRNSDKTKLQLLGHKFCHPGVDTIGVSLLWIFEVSGQAEHRGKFIAAILIEIGVAADTAVRFLDLCLRQFIWWIV